MKRAGDCPRAASWHTWRPSAPDPTVPAPASTPLAKSADDLGPRPYVLEGRAATLLEPGMLVYPHDDVLYMTMAIYAGDCWENCGSPPDMETLAADLLPKLPGPVD